MDSILESVEWGRQALDLLGHTWDLDPNLPAVMHVRHSERLPVDMRREGVHMPLTERGAEAAYEFGSRLPVDRAYRFHHTNIERTQATAENMQRGILENSGSASVEGEIPVFSVMDMEAYQGIIASLIREFQGMEGEGTRALINRWLAGIYSPKVLKPGIEFVQQAAAFMMENLRGSDPGDLHVWATHDGWLASFLYHWFGVYPYEWISFMGGFIVQFQEDAMILHFRGEKKEYNYPHWWSF